MDSALCLHNATILSDFAILPHCAVLLQDNKIAAVYNEDEFRRRKFAAEVELLDLQGAYLAPGLIDTHIHGMSGFSADRGDREQILGMSEALSHLGVTSFIPTFCAALEAEMLSKITAVTQAMGHETGARILGMHLEGPFISAAKIGAQPTDGVSPIDTALFTRFWQASNGRIVNMTVAPELDNIAELAACCHDKGVVLQAGHTNATYEQILNAKNLGILHATHMFNAMRPLHHREPGMVGAVLIHPEISCEFIADGAHFHPDLLQLLLKCKPLRQLVMITDAFYPAHTKLPANSDYYFDKCFRRRADDVIVGSGISLLDGVRNLIQWGVAPEIALAFASANPARIIHQSALGSIRPNYLADLIVLDHNFNLLYTIINGKLRKE